MSLMSVEEGRFKELNELADSGAARSRIIQYSVIAGIVVYLIASLYSFIPSDKPIWFPDRASMFMLDTYAYKDHVSMRWAKPEEIKVSHEGSRRFVYKGEGLPDWYEDGADFKTVSFSGGGSMSGLPR